MGGIWGIVILWYVPQALLFMLAFLIVGIVRACVKALIMRWKAEMRAEDLAAKSGEGTGCLYQTPIAA